MADVNKERSANGHKNDIFERLRKTGATSKPDRLLECFQAFDLDEDGGLDLQEFSTLLDSLFCNSDRPYELSDKQREDFFKLLDEDQDGKIDIEEFKVCWYHWLKQVLDPVTAFIIVDVQNDFISGTLAVRDCPSQHNGEEVVPIINKLIDEANFDHIIYSLDWHPHDHISFIENVKMRDLHHTSKVDADEAKSLDTVVFAGPPVMEQVLWPEHCVENSWGSELHPDMKVADDAIFIRKGTNPDIDSYSAFWDNKKINQTELVTELSHRHVTDVYVCGIAYDVCVGATTIDSLEHGFRTILINDASRGVSVEDIAKMKEKVTHHGGVIVDSDRVRDMVSALDRRPELGYQAALNVALARRLVKEGGSNAK